MEMNQRLKLQQQQQLLMQQAMLQQQQQLYDTGVLAAAISQMEPVPSGNLPPGFDPSSCRSVYVGNIHPNVTEGLLAEVFQSVGPLEGCKLIRKEKVFSGSLSEQLTERHYAFARALTDHFHNVCCNRFVG